MGKGLHFWVSYSEEGWIMGREGGRGNSYMEG